jgi:hypothetical protein
VHACKQSLEVTSIWVSATTEEEKTMLTMKRCVPTQDSENNENVEQ